MTTRIIETITAKDIDEHREVLCQWARANGIDPEDVAAGPGMTVERTGRRTVIVYHQIQRGGDGLALRDDSGGRLEVRTAVPLVEILELHGYPGSGPEIQVGDGE